mgnify:CR=1 FL=1
MDESAILAFAQQNNFPTSGPLFEHYRPQIVEALRAEEVRKARLGNQPGYQANDGSQTGGNSIKALMEGTNAAAGRTNQDGSAPTPVPTMAPTPGSPFTTGAQGSPLAPAQQQQLRGIGLDALGSHRATLNNPTQMGLADVQPTQPTRQVGVAGGAGSALSGSTVGKPAQQPAGFSYWQQFSPQAATSAMNSAPMRDAATAQLGASRARRNSIAGDRRHS